MPESLRSLRLCEKFSGGWQFTFSKQTLEKLCYQLYQTLHPMELKVRGRQQSLAMHFQAIICLLQIQISVR